jgi:predicted RNase H-like nuclease (RuvC/YqgF family)
MNALGKLLAVFVFLVSLVWLGFTVLLFATRSDWKAEALRAQKSATEAQTSADTLTKQVIEERKLYDNRLSSADQNITAIRKERNDIEKELIKLKTSVADIASQTQKLQPTLNEYQANNASLQNQTNNLTTQVSLLTAARDKAVFDQAEAEKRATDAALKLNVTEKALQDQAEKTRSLLEQRGGAAEADADFRGDVIQVGDKNGKSLDIITFTGGANAGVKAGKRYVVTRAAAPFYIGTVTVLDASNVQYSSGVFTPAAGQKLAGDYVPKKGDTVSSN